MVTVKFVSNILPVSGEIYSYPTFGAFFVTKTNESSPGAVFIKVELKTFTRRVY